MIFGLRARLHYVKNLPGSHAGALDDLRGWRMQSTRRNLPTDFLELDCGAQERAVSFASNELNQAPHILEKDVMVVWGLNAVFTSNFGDALSFKPHVEQSFGGSCYLIPEIYLFTNPNGEGFILARTAMANLLKERNRG
ncbi:hypothetical protein DUT91_21790 [Phyllobacterium salinisoli]|uniref:Uncharacterized protein n=1 Tax=Phyllobacterium salinisoli TaxID=1899321 RepID=A0A368K035_9HYPH|nr:hypothetical protein [Phyllobacterium salinisoli]RCS21813.1 hypothetical protein DUT91_21790 [Phyllobacterium salinisoli]